MTVIFFYFLHRNGCFLKWWYPQNTPKWSFLVGKPLVVGYHHFRKPPNISRWIMANPTAPLFFLQGNLAGSQPLPTSFSYNQTGKYKIHLYNMKKQQKTCRHKILIPMDPMDHFFHFCHCPIFFAIKFSPSSRTPDSRPESGIWPWNKTRVFHVLEAFTLLGCPGQEGTGLRQDQRNQKGDITPIYAIYK